MSKPQPYEPYPASKSLLCRQERVMDCTYGAMNGKIMNYSLNNPYELKTFVDPNVLVFDNVDLYPQAICDQAVLSRGNNNSTPRILEKSCYGEQCFIGSKPTGTKTFEHVSKSKRELPSPYRIC